VKVKETKIEKTTTNEETTKEIREEKMKQYEEVLNNDASAMDTDIIESSSKSPLTIGHPQSMNLDWDLSHPPRIEKWPI